MAKDIKINKNKTQSLTLRNVKSKKEDLHSGEGERQVNFTVKWQELWGQRWARGGNPVLEEERSQKR